MLSGSTIMKGKNVEWVDYNERKVEIPAKLNSQE